MNSFKVCILCRCTIPAPTSGDETDEEFASLCEYGKELELINKFVRCIQFSLTEDENEDKAGVLHPKEIPPFLPENSAPEKSNLITCGECSVLMKTTMEVKVGVDKVEATVRNLQVQLLKEMKNLQGHLNRFYLEMKKLEVLMNDGKTMSRVSRAVTGEDTNTINIFERTVHRVLKDLTVCQSNITSSSISVCDSSVVQNDPIITSLEKSVKIEIEEPHNPVENDVGQSDSNEEWEEQDDPENWTPAEEEKEEIHNIPCSSNLIKESSISSVNFQGMSQFKKELITRLIQRKDYIRDHGQLPTKIRTRTGFIADSSFEDPRNKYFIDYNTESGSLSLGEIIINFYEDSNEKFLECSKCSFRAADCRRYKIDMKMLDHILGKHLNAFQCQYCGQLIASHSHYLAHIKGHLIGYKCDICGRPFMKKRNISRHKWMHMNEDERQQAVNSGRQDPRLDRMRIKEKGTRTPFQCATCGKSFNKKGNLKTHEKTHATREERTTVCPICGKSMLEATFASHSRQVCKPAGEEIARVQCTECPRTFKSLFYMKYHFKRSHSEKGKERPFVCGTCGKGFRNRPALRKHLVSHSSERPFECSKGCGGRFKSGSVCGNHEKVCTGSGTRPGPKNGPRGNRNQS